MITFDLESLKLRTCQLKDCNSVAVGGNCNFKICFQRGCGRDYCIKHAGAGLINNDEEEQTEEIAWNNRVCAECQTKLTKTHFWALFAIIGITLLLLLPSLILHGGADTTSTTDAASLQ